MGPRRLTAYALTLAAVTAIAIAALVGVGAARLDAEAERIGQLWTEEQGNTELVRQSNAYYDRARELEGLLPMDPIVLAGVGLLLGAGAVATWPSSGRDDRGGDGTVAADAIHPTEGPTT